VASARMSRAALGLTLDLAVFGSAVLLTLAALVSWLGSGGRPDLGGLVCVGLIVAVSRFPLVLIHRSGDIIIGFETCVLVFLVLVYPPWEAFTLWAIGTTLASGTQRKAWRSRVFNVGITTLGGAIFVVAFSAYDHGPVTQASSLVAVLVGSAAYFALDLFVTAWSLALEGGSTIGDVLEGSSVLPGLVSFVAVNSLGFLAAVLVKDAPVWTVLLMMVPVTTMLVGIRSISENRMAQHRLAGLLAAATSAPDWTGDEQIAESLVEQTQITLGQPGVVLRDTPAVEPEVGVPMEVEGLPTRYLVVTRSTAYHEFSERDHAALEALGAIGAAAFNRRRLIDEMTHSARHDALTGLTNRTVFFDRITQAIGRGTGRDCIAVLYCDLDGFKEVNDRLGHDVGDQLLVLVSQRLLSCIRADDTAARLGGDEFGILIEDRAGERSAEVVAERVRDALMEPFSIDGSEVRVRVSIGIASSGPGLQDAESIIDAADMAMYSAKAAGKARIERFVAAMRDNERSRLELEAAVREAVAEQQLDVHYQPIVDLHSGVVVGFEALARWNHPVLGSVPPDVFIAVAERTGAIRDLGLQVLETAHAAACALADRAGHPLDISINVSAAQVTDPRLADRVRELAASRSDVRLVLELTEGSQLHDDLATLQALHRFKGYGAELALDDFGMGYSSVGYLDRLPFDVIKVDRSFVMRLDDPSSKALVGGIISMAQALGLSVVAEGIEDWARGEMLRDLGCRLGQGFFFARPMDLPTALEFAALGALNLTPTTRPA